MVQAAVMYGPGSPVEIQNFESPKLEDGAVLLETIYSEVCGTDVHLNKGQLAGIPYPIIPGHVSVGRVIDVNGEVCDIEGQAIMPGSTVTFLDVHNTCNHCWYCLVAKSSTKCPSRRVYGVTHSSVEGLFGGWSQQIHLQPGVKILQLPDTVSPLKFIAGGCALPTALHAVERGNVSIGDSVVVQGAGPVGLNAAILAKIAGARQVIIVDKLKHRLEMAARFGFTACLQLDENHKESHVDKVKALTGGHGADICIEATGSPRAIKDGIAMTRDSGQYIIVGHYSDTGVAEINPHLEINKKNLEIKGVWGVDFSHFYKALQVLESHDAPPGAQAKWEDMADKIYSLQDINQALDDVEHGRVVKAVIKPN
jgi:L-iditol 2-dehydrogenase